MKYAAVNSKGDFTGVVYEEINDRIIADRAQYGETIVAIDRKLVDASASELGTAQPDYGKPTVEELQSEIYTFTMLVNMVKDLQARVNKLEGG